MIVIDIARTRGGWALELPEESRVLAINQTKYEAVERAMEIARSNPPSKVRILDADGSVQEERCFECPRRSGHGEGDPPRQSTRRDQAGSGL